MDEKYKIFAKDRLKNLLLECDQVEITVEELYTLLTSQDVPLRYKSLDTMFTSTNSKTISNLYTLLRILTDKLKRMVYYWEYKHAPVKLSEERRIINYMTKLLSK